MVQDKNKSIIPKNDMADPNKFNSYPEVKG